MAMACSTTFKHAVCGGMPHAPPGMSMLLHKSAHAHTVHAMCAEACALAYLAPRAPVRFTPDF
eukprot:11439558-Alexandrium_andersonii.AAC.1